MNLDWKKTAGIAAGAGLMLLTLFANQAGLDNNPEWGAKRYIFFFAGLSLLILSLFCRRDNFIGRFFGTPEGHLYLGTAVVSIGVIIYYVWCVTIGLWAKWPYETDYYDLQATAFYHGQIALEVQPDPALLAFEGFDVYVPENRKGIPILWDATLYDGKYYLYWGPVPAILLAGGKVLFSAPVGDNIVTFAFLVGTFLFMTALILEFRKNYHPATPQWAVWLAVAMSGTVNPMPYLLFEPRIYEASIIAAQFFLMGGFYWLFSAFRKPSVPRFGLSGLFLACAVGSRTAVFPAVALLALTALLWTVKFHRAKIPAFIGAMALPLMLGAAGYAWYNHARFGSVAEFGLRYQITAYNQMTDRMFSLAFVPFNAYKALFNPLELRPSFPYVFPTRWVGPASLEAGNYPLYYELFAEKITGVLFGSPFLFFALLSGLNKDRQYRWVLASLTGSTLLSFFVTQLFFFASMRYMLDFVPSLSLLAVLGFWQWLEMSGSPPVARFFHATLGLFLFAYGALVSLLVSISAHLEQIRVFNPQMLRQLLWFFDRIFH